MTEPAPRIILEDGYDLDALRRTGEYTATNPTNAPLEEGFFFINVISAPVQGNAYTLQRAHDVTTGTIYTRVRSGTWGEWTSTGAGPGGGDLPAYWNTAPVAVTAPAIIDPTEGYQFNVTGVADEDFNLGPGVPGQRMSLTLVGGAASARFRADPDTGEFAIRDRFGNFILGFDIDTVGDSVLLEYRLPQANNGGWHIVNAYEFTTIYPVSAGQAGLRPIYDLNFNWIGTVAAEQSIFTYYVTRPILWDDGFNSRSGGFAAVLPATDQVFTITFDNTQIGTMEVSAADGYCQITIDDGGNDYTTLGVGGLLRIVAPEVPDGTMADFAVTLAGYVGE